MTNSRFSLSDVQNKAISTRSNELLYGGAAGGGKSFLMRVTACAYALSVAGVQIYFFRRNFPDFEYNHMAGDSGLLGMLHPYLADGTVKYNQQKHVFSFSNGSQIYICHLNSARDLYNYQGAEIHLLLIDEVTQFYENEYRYLRARVRLGSYQPQGELADTLPRIIASGNPGGVGHQWVKRTFVDFAPPFKIKQADEDEGGMLRQYIPARVNDNAYIGDDYKNRLAGLGSPEMVRAWLEGDWDIVAGAAFEKLSRDEHMLREFVPPKHWTHFMAMDWGSAKPYSVGWYVVAEGNAVIKGKGHWPDRHIPDGALIRYRELYGWGGMPDVGTREESVEVARRIIEIEEAADERMDYRVADSAMWAKTDGPSVFERMFELGLNLGQAKKDRVSNYQEVRHRIAGDDAPMFYITENCHHFWRTVPTLQLDELHPEKGPDTTQEDHCYDELSYALASRPWISTMRMRYDSTREKDKREKRKISGGSIDPYSIKRKLRY